MRHSKRLMPSGYCEEGGAREMVRALLQFGQTIGTEEFRLICGFYEGE